MAMTVLAGAGIYEAYEAASLAKEVSALKGERQNRSEAEATLSRQRDEARSQLASLQGANSSDSQELASIKAEDAEVAKDPSEVAIVDWLDRVDRLKQHLAQMPKECIPEMQFLKPDDWLSVTSAKLDTEEDFARAMSGLRNAAENRFAALVSPALQKYMTENGGQFPTDVTQLQGYFDTPMANDILERWTIVLSSQIPSLHFNGGWVITQKSVLNPTNDVHVAIGKNSTMVMTTGFSGTN